MLFTEKIVIISIHTLAGPYILPFTLYNKVCLMELYVKNKDVNEYYQKIKKRDNMFADQLFRIF